jgi:hypothetical protein
MKRHANAIMPQDLAQVATAPSEDIKITGMGITPEALLYLQGQGSHALPHIGMPGRDPYPDAGGNWDHGLTDRNTADTNPGDAPAGMRTIARSNSTMIADPITGTGSGCTCTSAKPWAACPICRRHL